MNDAFFIIFILSLITANVVVFICAFAGRKRGKENVRTILKASEDMITGLDRFRNDIPEMAEKLVSDVKPAIDSYIKERVEAYIKANAVAETAATDIQEIEPIRSPFDNAVRMSSDSVDIRHDMPMTQGLSFEDIEAVIEKACSPELYKDTFLHEPERKFRASAGKQVNIRPEYHRSILMILESAGCDCVTLTGFLDNVLAYHFKNYGCNIRKIINTRHIDTEGL